MKKQLLLFAMILLPLVASAHDIVVKNADGVTIYYNYINNGTELEVSRYSFSDEYQGNVAIPEEVTIMNRTRKVTSIGSLAFKGCYKLTSITIPNSVTSIGGYAFYDCSGLKKVIVKDIAAWCGIKFYNSYSNPLYYAKHIYSDEDTEITNLIIPNSVTSIESNAFKSCSYLTSVTIPNSVTSIGEYAFKSCSGLTSVTIPNSVTSIGEWAFAGCSGLTSITIPNSVTSIGVWAFDGCSGLTSVTIGSGVTSIGGYAFSGCSGLTSVTIPNSVTSIENGAFAGCSGLTSITIPNSVTIIGNDAFHYCDGLRKVIVKDIASWCRIKFYGAYSNPLIYAKHIYSDENTEITNLIIPNSVTSIGGSAFSCCSGLTSITIPNSVTSIGWGAFDGCSGLTSVTIPNSVTSIGGSAFQYCSGLTSITIPNSVTSIGGGAFEYCSGLTSVTIPNSVTSIGNYAFYSCSGLTSVTIGSGVTSIGDGAFDGVDIPTVISLIENPFTITGKTSDYRTFTQNTFNHATLYVPKGTIDKYKATDGWKDFLSIEEGAGGGDTEGLSRCVTNAVLIQSEGGSIKVQGVDEGTQVNVYGINGTQAGSAISQSGAATINTNLQPGSVAIVKIGKKSVKVVMK